MVSNIPAKLTQIELAPGHKRGLTLNSPFIAESGCWGFVDEYSKLINMHLLGAMTTNPITVYPRQPARGVQIRETNPGIALHTGLPNPGIHKALLKFGKKWSQFSCPIIVHLAVDNPDEVNECIYQLEEQDNVLGIELGFHHHENPNHAAAIITKAAKGSLPIVVKVPFENPETFAKLAQDSGAQAITLTAPARTTIPDKTTWFEGRMYGANTFGIILTLVRKLSQTINLPIVAAGDVHNNDQVKTLLRAGAKAVQLGSVVWVHPSRVNLILQSWHN